MEAGDIKVKKRDLPMAEIGRRVFWQQIEYRVVSDGGIGPWGYWILRPVAVMNAVWRSEDSPQPVLPDAEPNPGLIAQKTDGFSPGGGAFGGAGAGADFDVPPPVSFMQGLDDCAAGRTVDLDTALSQPPPSDTPNSDTPTPVLENPDPPSTPDPAPSYEPSAPDPTPDYSPDPSPSMDVSPDTSSSDNSGVC